MRFSNRAKIERNFLARPVFHLFVSLSISIPLFLFHDIPLLDLPIHVAQEHILFDPVLARANQYYIGEWRLFPNMALDVIVYILHILMPLDLAIKVFLAIILLQLYWGVQAIAGALSNTVGTSFGLAAALFVYNGPFMMGFVDLSFGIGMSFWVFALWLRYGQRMTTLIPFAVLAMVILLAHLFAFAIYALCTGCYAAGLLVAAMRTRDRRVITRICVSGLHLLAPVLLFRFGIAHDAAEAFIQPSNLHRKLWALLTLPGVYDLLFNIRFLALLLLGFVFIVRRVEIVKTMLPVLGALLIAFIALPYQIALGTWVDYRVPTIFVLLLVGSLKWRVSQTSMRAAEWVILVLFIIRMGLLCSEWSEWQPVFDEYHTAFRLLPMGTKLLPVGTHPEVLEPAEHPPLNHVDALAVAERGAFVPTMLAGLPYQMLHYAPTVLTLEQSFKLGTATQTDYDYILIVHPDATNTPPNIEPVFRGHDFLLARIIK